MATSKCGHCDGTSFETKEASVKNSNFTLFFVQCASCGVPVTVLEAQNSTKNFSDLKRELDFLKAQIAGLR
jgi:uncharacterized protein (UPF0276 family)